jgi:four helix bundle protein
MMPDYHRLTVWKKSHDLVLAVYAATARFPSAERYGLTSQVRRGAVSIPSNIVEGCSRRGDGEFKRFLSIALGSAAEVEYQLLLARDLGFLPPEAHERLTSQVSEVGRMLGALHRTVRRAASS